MTLTPVDILLVEDNRDDVELTLHALKRNHLANGVHIVRDGEEALDFIFGRGPYKSRPPSTPKVILLDLKLPKIDGIEVLRAIRNDVRTQGLPVVVMISSVIQKEMIEDTLLSATHYLMKPLDFEEFRGLIKQLGFSWLVVQQEPRLSDGGD